MADWLEVGMLSACFGLGVDGSLFFDGGIWVCGVGFVLFWQLEVDGSVVGVLVVVAWRVFWSRF